MADSASRLGMGCGMKLIALQRGILNADGKCHLRLMVANFFRMQATSSRKRAKANCGSARANAIVTTLAVVRATVSQVRASAIAAVASAAHSLSAGETRRWKTGGHERGFVPTDQAPHRLWRTIHELIRARSFRSEVDRRWRYARRTMAR